MIEPVETPHVDLLYADDNCTIQLIWPYPKGVGSIPGLSIEVGGNVIAMPPIEWHEMGVTLNRGNLDKLMARNQLLETHVNILNGQLDVIRAAVQRQWSLSP